MDSIYGLNYSVKSFAVANNFVVNTNKACYKLGQSLQPFCFYATEEQKKFGVIDFAKFDGMTNSGKSFLDEIAQYRAGVFASNGLRIDISDDLAKKYLLYDYLMTISICYVEIPKWSTRDGAPVPTYDKFLCTRNPAIMAAWMGTQPNEMQAKYSAKIFCGQVDFDNKDIRCVKLNHSASKGNSITVPRSLFSIENMRCIPMYMLYAFIEGFKPVIQEKIVKFSFLKDNGTIRELATTLNKDILSDYYSDSMFVSTMLSGVDINSVEQGGMHLSSKMNRGYIKVPELGASIYDGTGVRSLNIARLLKAEVVDSVDRSFINVDLNSVVQNFKDGLDYAVKKNKPIGEIYRAIIGKEPETDQVPLLITALCNYVDSRSMLLSTTFHRSLHTFIVSHPDWFPLYTGKPSALVTSSENYGVAPMDDF